MSDLYVFDSPFGVLALTKEQLELGLSSGEVVRISPSEPTPENSHTVTLADAEEAATALGVPSSWLLQRARERRIPFVQLGKYVRFDVERIRGEMTKERK